MQYKITTSYNWYETEEDKFIIKTYHINGIPFTFDEIPTLVQDDPEVIAWADEQLTMSPESRERKSMERRDEQGRP